MSVKWLYLAPRAPGLTSEDFPAAWLGHAKLAAQFPDLLGHFDATLYCLLAPDMAAGYDAAAIITLPDLAAIEAVLAHPLAATIIQPDERRVFGDIIPRFSLSAHGELLSRAAIGKNARFAFLRAASSAAAFTDLLRNSIKERLLPHGMSSIANCVVNWMVPGPFESAHDYTAMVEYYADDDERWENWADFVRNAEWCGPGALFTGGRVIMNWKRPTG